jgi:hypothetical protein
MITHVMQGNKIMYVMGVGGSCLLAMFAAYMAFG